MDVTLGLCSISALQHTVMSDAGITEELFQHRGCFQGRNHLGQAREG